MAINFKQVTERDIASIEPIEKGNIRVGGEILNDVPYKIIDNSILGSTAIHKMGYCSNSNYGKDFPIFLTLNGIEKDYYIGKTGMYEFQREDWDDVNDPRDPSSDTGPAEVSLSRVLVPADFSFCLDYCYGDK